MLVLKIIGVSNMTRILICGSRYWLMKGHSLSKQEETARTKEILGRVGIIMFQQLRQFNNDIQIVHGGAIGVDTLATIINSIFPKHLEPEIHLPKYEIYGNGAPLKRDEEMVNSGVEYVLA